MRISRLVVVSVALFAVTFAMGQGGDLCGCVPTSPTCQVRNITVRIVTADEPLAGTDDDVFFSIGGGFEWKLNNVVNNFEQGQTDEFEIPVEISICDFQEIRLRKSPDGPLGGWLLEGITVITENLDGTEEVLYDNPSIFVWLEDTELEWVASDFVPPCGTTP
ncbi:MAG: hypothetical protein D6795_19750 [Deltaproteobacteria bacterium]|nr:MAG: hypothetical protein D6795_19750 [Deltaproteobacteria bacterium]